MKRYLLLLFFSTAILEGYAYDFSAVCSTGQTLYYNIISSSTVQITHPSDYDGNYYFGYAMPSGNLVIPDSVFYDSSYYRVTRIGSHAFSCCGNINNLVIPNSVYVISEYAFHNCLGIDSLYLGSAVQSIGQYAFSGCTGLSYMYYNASHLLTEHFMDEWHSSSHRCSPFYGTSTPNFTTLVIGDSVNTIPEYCFYNRNCIDSVVVIPSNVTSIGQYAFFNCNGIDILYLDLGSGITTIADYSFHNCPGIHKLTIPDNVTNIGPNAFEGCSGIDSLYIGSGVSSVGESAFSGCTGLRYLYL